MPELRQISFTKKWVIIATERAKRPEELATHCLAPVQPVRSLPHLRRRVSGFGFHEVIVDGPDHSRCMAMLSDEHVATILGIYKQPYNVLSLDPRIRHITIFKNHGLDAGASLQHPHSQLIATPVIPSQVRHRLCEACVTTTMSERACFATWSSARSRTRRVVLKNEHFVAMEVFASATPFTTHIFPLRHMASFGDISELELSDLARILRRCWPRSISDLRIPI